MIIKNKEKIKTQKEVTKLTPDKLKNQIENFLKNNINKKRIKNKVKEGIFNGHFQKYDKRLEKYYIIIDVIVNNRAECYIVKELLEYFGFKVNEKRYLEDPSYYHDNLNYILSLAEKWLNNNIDLNGLTLKFNYNNNYSLIAVFSYDYIPDYYRKKNITSTDDNLDISLAEYASLWELDNGNLKAIFSAYDPDNKKILYKTCIFQNKKEIIKTINNLLYYFTETTQERILQFIPNLFDYNNKIKSLIAIKRTYKNLFYKIALSIMDNMCRIDDFIISEFSYIKKDIPLEILNKEIGRNVNFST